MKDYNYYENLIKEMEERAIYYIKRNEFKNASKVLNEIQRIVDYYNED